MMIVLQDKIKLPLWAGLTLFLGQCHGDAPSEIVAEQDLIPPGKPAWLNVTSTPNRTLVTWGAPLEQHIQIRNYVLIYGTYLSNIDVLILDNNTRSYEIFDLQPDEDYIISINARNAIGDGEAQYAFIQLRNELHVDTNITALLEPNGVRAITLSESLIAVYWIDANQNTEANDSHQFLVRYTATDLSRYRYFNTSDLAYTIDNLRPNTRYEFAVKITKGQQVSPWSISAWNSTLPAI